MTMHVRAWHAVYMNTMTAPALAAKLAAPHTFTLGELSIIARAFGVAPHELLVAVV